MTLGTLAGSEHISLFVSVLYICAEVKHMEHLGLK